MARLLFVAPASESWGEFLVGRRIAKDLAARGHTLTFLIPSALAPQLKGVPCRIGYIDGATANLDRAILSAIAETKSDAIVLVDICLVFMQLSKLRACQRFLDNVSVPLFALDVWDLRRTNLRWDFGDVDWVHPPENLLPERRLLPVPFINFTTGSPGLYCALPERTQKGDRKAGRALFGVANEPVLLLASASWQRPGFQWLGPTKRLAERMPEWFAHLFSKLRKDAVICHVGPDSFAPIAGALGSRYRHVPQLHPDSFRDALAAADLFLSCNFAASSIIAALHAEVPVVLAQNSASGRTAEEITAHVPRTDALLRWLKPSLPLHKFRVWPYGMYNFLAPLYADNPYVDALTLVELLDESAFVLACDPLLSDSAEREKALNRQAQYVQEVEKLPSSSELIEKGLPCS